MRMRGTQRGLAAAAILVVIILAALALIFGRGALRQEAVLGEQGLTEARLKRASDALVGFAVTHRRLPCPARGVSDTGKEWPNPMPSPSATCANAGVSNDDGVVPWAALGISREDAVDAWGGKFSYRVYAPADASDGFTREGGVDATACNTEVSAGVDPVAVTDCSPSTHSDHFLHFVRATLDPARMRGLVVSDRGSTRDGLAFVLISHGPSGRGAFGATSNQRALLPASAAELRNTQGLTAPVWSSPFVADARSDVSLTPDDPDHFDDIVSYMTASELIIRAGLGARAWPTTATTLDRNTIKDAVPGFDPDATQDTGRSSIVVDDVTITATSSAPGTPNIGFSESGGIGGIGALPGGATAGGSLSSAEGESLVFRFGVGSAMRKIDLAFNDFRKEQDAPPVEERVEISLWRDGARLQTTTIASWIPEGATGASNCLFAVAPGNEFDRLEIRPLARTGDGGDSSLTVAAFKACTAAIDDSSCATTIPGSTPCPSRPSSAGTAAATGVTADGATLHAIMNANGAAASAGFDIGLTASYGASVSATPAALAGFGDSATLAGVSGLACATTHHYRATGTGSGGTTTGNDMTFTTAACP